MTKTTAWYAKQYIKQVGVAIVPIEPNRKYPRTRDWVNKVLACPDVAEAFFTKNPDYNMGMALHQSKICSIDVDCFKSFSIICDALGIDLKELIDSAPTIQGKAPGLRIEFRVPEGIDLPYVKLNWRPESDPTGEIHRDLLHQAREARDEGNTELEEELKNEAKKHAMYTVFELRSATDGSQKQNVLPPSIHPETQQPYRWLTQPRKDWPEPPKWLIALWQEFDKIKPQMMAACPWVDLDDLYSRKTKPKNKEVTYNGAGGGLVSVVNRYNNERSVITEAENYGYKVKGKRMLSPLSTTGLPGVVVFESSNKLWIHHASDPLCSDETGRPVAPFDLLCYYDYNGDYKTAAQAIAKEMGIRTNAPARVDYETGEVLEKTNDTTAPVDYLSLLPWADGNKRPYKHYENLLEICRRLGVTIRYNVIKKEEEILIPGSGFSVDNQANAALAWLTSQCSLFNFPTDGLQEMVTLIADKNQFNPVTAWIESKPWDGVPRLPDLYATITESKHFSAGLKEKLMFRWFISAVAAAFSPAGISARGVMVFQGDQQIGKTAWFKRLVPEHLDVIQDGVILRPDDKDSVKQAVSHWLVELGELDATFKRSDIAQLKGFISKQLDEVRLPYARKSSKFARRTVFFGSVNPREFLNDPTGNTRFWTIPCEKINFLHDLDMQQVWAEVYHHYENGASHNLTSEETDLLNMSNDSYMAIDPIEERLLNVFDWESDQTSWRWIQATNAFIEAGVDRPTRADATKAAMFIRRMNGGQGKREASGRRLLLVPRKEYI